MGMLKLYLQAHRPRLFNKFIQATGKEWSLQLALARPGPALELSVEFSSLFGVYSYGHVQ